DAGCSRDPEQPVIDLAEVKPSVSQHEALGQEDLCVASLESVDDVTGESRVNGGLKRRVTPRGTDGQNPRRRWIERALDDAGAKICCSLVIPGSDAPTWVTRDLDVVFVGRRCVGLPRAPVSVAGDFPATPGERA